ncbi:MAG: hypothetical protein LBP42_02020 [Treponema sp.]|nr:hypothetical protein [Treponema sp.]
MADPIGLRVGLYADSPDILADQREYFLTPQLEYEHSFRNFAFHIEGEYTFALGEAFPQFFFAEEGITARLPLGPRSEFQLGLQNENDFRFNPDRADGRGSGRVKPELGYGLFLPPGDFSLSLGAPLAYFLWGGDNPLFSLEARAAYTTPFWLGIEAAAAFNVVPDAGFEGLEFAVNYTQDPFYGRLVFKAKESLGYFSLKAELDYFFNFFILKAGAELKNLGSRDALTLAPAVGIKYRF